MLIFVLVLVVDLKRVVEELVIMFVEKVVTEVIVVAVDADDEM